MQIYYNTEVFLLKKTKHMSENQGKQKCQTAYSCGIFVHAYTGK